MNHTITIIISGCNILNPIRTISAKILPFYHLIQFDLVVVLTLIFEYDVFAKLSSQNDKMKREKRRILYKIGLKLRMETDGNEVYRFHQFFYCISFLQIRRTISNIIMHILLMRFLYKFLTCRFHVLISCNVISERVNF